MAHAKHPHSKFTPDEDKHLRTLIEQCSALDWAIIAESMEGRSPRQCKERWVNYLCPELNNTIWSEDDDLLLLQKHNEIGPRWVAIAKFFPKRTDSMLKNRFNRLCRRCQKRTRLLFQRPVSLAGTVTWHPVGVSTQPTPGPLPVPLSLQLGAENLEEEAEFNLWSDGFDRPIDSGLDYPFI
jgi:hypothetical protein